MREKIMTGFFLTIFKQTVITWTSEAVDKPDQPGRRM